MKEEHPISRIARLVYGRDDSEPAIAAELRVSSDELAQWLATDLAPTTRLLMKGFAVSKAAVLQQRARQLLATAASL